MTIPLQFASLYDGQEVFVWSDCLLDLGKDFKQQTDKPTINTQENTEGNGKRKKLSVAFKMKGLCLMAGIPLLQFLSSLSIQPTFLYSLRVLLE